MCPVVGYEPNNLIAGVRSSWRTLIAAEIVAGAAAGIAEVALRIAGQHPRFIIILIAIATIFGLFLYERSKALEIRRNVVTVSWLYGLLSIRRNVTEVRSINIASYRVVAQFIGSRFPSSITIEFVHKRSMPSELLAFADSLIETRKGNPGTNKGVRGRIKGDE